MKKNTLFPSNFVSFNFRLEGGGRKLEGADFKPLNWGGSEIKRERIWEFFIEMFVSLKGGQN